MSGSVNKERKQKIIGLIFIIICGLLASWYGSYDYETFIVGQSWDDNDETYYLRCNVEEGRKILRLLKPDLPEGYEASLFPDELEQENNIAINQLASDLMLQLGYSKNPPAYSYFFEKDLNRGKVVVAEALIEIWLRGKEKRELKKGEFAEAMAKIKLE